jgi:hypothetical protein
MLRFVRAFVDATEWALEATNCDETLRLLQEYQDISRQLAEIKLRQVIPKAAIDPGDLNRVVQLRIEMGLYNLLDVPLERFYDASIWAEATGLLAPPAFGLPQGYHIGDRHRCGGRGAE